LRFLGLRSNGRRRKSGRNQEPESDRTFHGDSPI
jgi:hypothetical protein